MNVSPLGDRIRTERLALQLSQQKAAEACGVRREQWGKYERGANEIGAHALALFGALGADVLFVLTGQRAGGDRRGMADVVMAAAQDRADLDLAVAAIRSVQNGEQALQDAVENSRVRQLLGLLIFCDDAAIERVIRFAAQQAGKRPMLFAERQARDSSAAVELPSAGTKSGASGLGGGRYTVTLDEAHRTHRATDAEKQRPLPSIGRATIAYTATPIRKEIDGGKTKQAGGKSAISVRKVSPRKPQRT